jgi:thiol-disulfide isomerase/thioredoxin
MKLIVAALALAVAAADASSVPSWACALKNCALKSPLALEGPGFPDGVRFFAAGSSVKDTRAACPFGGDDGPEATKEEYMKYMKGLSKVGDMNSEQRRAYAIANQERWLNEEAPERKIKAPTVDISKPGVEAVNSTEWSELRQANKFDMLITFYAPWCPHCKAFVLGDNAPLKALNERLEKVEGPKVVSFDIEKSTPPISIDAVPTIYLFKKTGEAIPYNEDPHNLAALLSWSVDHMSAPAKATESLVAKKVAQHTAPIVPHILPATVAVNGPTGPLHHDIPAWACPLKNCALKSATAMEGPGFQDGVRFFAMGSDGKDSRSACPFGGEDGPEPSKKEYLKYMRAMSKVGDMSPEERRAYAIANQDKWLNEEEPTRKVGKPSVDIAKPGVESVNETSWSELRKANKFDMLITFYAAWCPHCKALVLAEYAPIKALSASLEKVDGAKVVTFDIDKSEPPITINSVPTIYLFKKTGEAIEFEGNPHEVESLMKWAVDNQSRAPPPTTESLAKESLVAKQTVQHLRKPKTYTSHALGLA